MLYSLANFWGVTNTDTTSCRLLKICPELSIFCRILTLDVPDCICVCVCVCGINLFWVWKGISQPERKLLDPNFDLYRFGPKFSGGLFAHVLLISRVLSLLETWGNIHPVIDSRAAILYMKTVYWNSVATKLGSPLQTASHISQCFSLRLIQWLHGLRRGSWAPVHWIAVSIPA
jgi:hypothetical protein